MSSEFGIRELVNAYRRGVFPMADSRDDPYLFLIDPDERGILPLDEFHVPTRLARTVKQDRFEVTVDRAFSRVMDGCAEITNDRETTWINSAIINLYGSLHRRGFAHSVECWDGRTLAGGLYGVAIGGVFFGESMFSRARDASKIALVHLVGRLIAGGFELLDAQFHNPHLDQFGLKRIPRDEFKAMLDASIDKPASFHCEGAPTSGADALHLITQMS